MATRAQDLIAKLRGQRKQQNTRIQNMRDRFGTQMANSLPANQVAQMMQSFNPYQGQQSFPYQSYFNQMPPQFQQMPQQQQQPQPQYQPEQQAPQPQQDMPIQSMNANYTQAFGGGSGVYYTPAPQVQRQVQPQPQSQPQPQYQPEPQRQQEQMPAVNPQMTQPLLGAQQTSPQQQSNYRPAQQSQQPQQVQQPRIPAQQTMRPLGGGMRPRPHANLIQQSKPQATLNPQRQLQQRIMRPKPVY